VCLCVGVLRTIACVNMHVVLNLIKRLHGSSHGSRRIGGKAGWRGHVGGWNTKLHVVANSLTLAQESGEICFGSLYRVVGCVVLVYAGV